LPVVDFEAGLIGVRACHGDSALRKINTEDACAFLCQCFAQQAATATNVQYLRAMETGTSPNVVDAQRIDVVKCLQWSIRIPPVVRDRLELGELRRIQIDGW